MLSLTQSYPDDFRRPLFIPETFMGFRQAAFDPFASEPISIKVSISYYSSFPHIYPYRFVWEDNFVERIKLGSRVILGGSIWSPFTQSMKFQQDIVDGWVIGYHDDKDGLVEYTVLGRCCGELRVVFLVVPLKNVEYARTDPFLIAESGFTYWNYLHSREIHACARASLELNGIFVGWGISGSSVHELLLKLRCTPINGKVVGRDPTELSLVSF